MEPTALTSMSQEDWWYYRKKKANFLRQRHKST